METAGEGGAWGIALLGSYLVNNEKNQSLADFLEDKVFAGDAGIEISPTAEDVAGFNTYIETIRQDCLLKKQRPDLRSESNGLKRASLHVAVYT